MTAFGETPRVLSVDLTAPAIRDPRITFIEGDCEAIERVFDEGTLAAAAHPWLLIEDAHVNVFGVLDFFHPRLAPGDYVVVEDSDGKRDEIARFLARYPQCYAVDTYYTDFFGRNATCAPDSFLVRTPADAGAAVRRAGGD
jgi:cephalosporin hydroxylase